MPVLEFLTNDGRAYRIATAAGRSLMEVAVTHDVPGIDADCRGSCACATCHVVLDDEWRGVLRSPRPVERELLSCLPSRVPGSRLACQIRIEEAHEGLRVRVPA